MVLAQCWNLTSLFPEIIGPRKESFEFIFELVLAWCWNLKGFILDFLRYGSASQRLFREGFGLVLVSCWDLTDLTLKSLPVMAWNHKDFLQESFSLISTWCSNLEGLSLKPQRIFRVYF